MKLTKYLDEVFLPARDGLLGFHTIRHYRYTIKRFELSLKRPAAMEDLNDTALNRFLLMLSDEGLQQKTVERHRAMLTRLWRWAFNRGDIKRLSKSKNLLTTHAPRKRAPHWTPAELDTLFISITTKLEDAPNE